MSNYNLIAANDVKCQVYSALLRFRPKYKESYINKAKERAKQTELPRTVMEMSWERLKTIIKQCQGKKLILNNGETQSMFGK